MTDQNNSMLEQTIQHPEGFVQPSASTETRPPLPPFTADTAVLKVRLAEDGWNSRDPEKVSLAYAPNSRWRNRAEFVNGRQEIVAFLTRKWARELDYRLIKELWAFEGNRIAVRFAYEWHDDSFNWFRSYGNENWDSTTTVSCAGGSPASTTSRSEKSNANFIGHSADDRETIPS